MVRQKIKAVIFDIGGVLQLGKKSDEKGIHLKVAKILGFDLDSLFDAIDTPYAKSIIGEIPESEFVKWVSNNLSISGKKLKSIYINVIKNHFVKNEKLFELAKKLKNKGYIIGILSDQWYFSKKVLMPKKDFKMFDVQVVSCDVGLRKPDKKIYELLLNKLRNVDKQIKVQEIIFIDNRDYNLKPAKKMKMKTILFEDNNSVLKGLKKFGVNI